MGVRGRRWWARGRAVTFTSLLAVGVAVMLDDVSSAAETCVRAVDADAEGAGAEAALVQALADAQTPVADGDCTAWRVDLAGMFRLTDTLEWLDPVPLTMAGPDGGTARLEADDDDGSVDHRLLTVDTFPDTVTVTLERLVLAGGDVSGLVDDGLGSIEGGAILADDVALVDTLVTGNRADVGGAVSTFTLEATRTTFTGNEAELGTATGGAVAAYGTVTLENVTFTSNVAGEGGALWVDLSVADDDLTATFVTFSGNEASDATSGAALHVDGVGDTSQVTLRGVLLAGPGDGSTAGACGGPEDLAADGAPLTWTDSVATDLTCGSPATIDAPTFTSTAFRTGMGDLLLPAADSEAIDSVTCGDGWPSTDQRGLARPQGDACDAGAVEREVVEESESEPEPEPEPAPDPDPAPEPDAVPEAPPVPTEVPAGGGACAGPVTC